ncbi:MAG: nucleotidyltransferase domain-containing protein [Candidatus Delongbacteria bacterium]|nr:nucleotidyltransferase domain-containing protein [Candidatus Delongbacteria bacterium]MCG2759851.1 nucleotidyltransferase domain-containing protein [Candidatus Delongbacteria bacterium]
MDKKQAIESVKEYSILIRNVLDPYKIYLFGSYANGNWNEFSDIDVAIIFKNLNKDYLDVLQNLYKLRRQVNDNIEPVLLDFYNDPSGFMHDIMENGEEIILP